MKLVSKNIPKLYFSNKSVFEMSTAYIIVHWVYFDKLGQLTINISFHMGLNMNARKERKNKTQRTVVCIRRSTTYQSSEFQWFKLVWDVWVSCNWNRKLNAMPKNSPFRSCKLEKDFSPPNYRKRSMFGYDIQLSSSSWGLSRERPYCPNEFVPPVPALYFLCSTNCWSHPRSCGVWPTWSEIFLYLFYQVPHQKGCLFPGCHPLFS